MGAVFGGGGLRSLDVFVEHADQFGALHFAVHARVIPPEFTGSNNGDAHLSRFRSRRHSLFIPAKVSFGSPDAAATAWIAIPAASASSITFTLPTLKIRPQS